MEIGPLHNEKPIAPGERTRFEKKEPLQQQAGRADSLEISSSSRQKLAHMADSIREKYGISDSVKPAQNESITATAIRQDKVKQARERIQSGFYEQRHVKESIAGKLTEKIRNLSQRDET